MKKNKVSLQKTVEGTNNVEVETNRGTCNRGFTLQTLVFAVILNIGLVTVVMHVMSKR